MLDCGNVGLNGSIPDMIPNHVVVVNFHRNGIEQLQTNSFADCVNVTSLNLSSNRIKVIRNSMLIGMPNLEEIDLEDNLLYYNESSFPGNPFENLPHLKSVNIIESDIPVYPSLDDFELIIQKLPHMLEVIGVLIPECDGISPKCDGFSSKFTQFHETE